MYQIWERIGSYLWNGLFYSFLPLCFILSSYLRILVVVLKMNSEGSRMKAFSTCGSHLVVVYILQHSTVQLYPSSDQRNQLDGQNYHCLLCSANTHAEPFNLHAQK